MNDAKLDDRMRVAAFFLSTAALDSGRGDNESKEENSLWCMMRRGVAKTDKIDKKDHPDPHLTLLRVISCLFLVPTWFEEIGPPAL